MHVKKYTISLSQKTGNTDNNIIIPIDLTSQNVGQSEDIDRDFIDEELRIGVNPISDYEKVRFTPINGINAVSSITYSLKFKNSQAYPLSSYYGDLGFEYDDIKFRKNRFSKSFLRLNFYDSDIATNQRLINFTTIYSRIAKEYTIPFQTNGQPNVKGGLPLPVEAIPTKFIVSNPIIEPEGFSEGFYIYDFKDEVSEDLPKEIYMRAEFNNAKDGSRVVFMTQPNPLSLSEMFKKLYTKYILIRQGTGFYYALDISYSNNIIVTGVGNDKKFEIKLYETQVT